MIDVTDPKNPQVAKLIPGPETSGRGRRKKRQPREIGHFMAGLPGKLHLASYGRYVRMEDVPVDNVTGGAAGDCTCYVLRYTGSVEN